MMYLRNTLLGWFGAALLLGACWLFWDGAAGLLGWRGLRSTRARPAVVLGLSAGALGLFAAIVATISVSRFAVVLAVVLALPLHLLVATFRHRSAQPDPWIREGRWARHNVAAVDLPAGGESVPALYYEPLESSVGALVLVHGAGAHKTFYTWPMIEALLEVGFAVCTIDLAGHGDSQRVLELRSALEDVETAVAWARERTTWVGMVGVSLGGCVAARAVAEGLQLQALALFEAPIQVNITRRVARHERLTLARAATWSLHRYAGTLPLVRAWSTRPTRSRISTEDLIRALDLRGSLALIDCPVWLCYAGSDWVVPLSEARRAAAAAPAGTPLVIVPRATHLSLPIDRRALQALRAWLLSTRQDAASREIPVSG